MSRKAVVVELDRVYVLIAMWIVVAVLLIFVGNNYADLDPDYIVLISLVIVGFLFLICAVAWTGLSKQQSTTTTTTSTDDKKAPII